MIQKIICDLFIDSFFLELDFGYIQQPNAQSPDGGVLGANFVFLEFRDNARHFDYSCYINTMHYNLDVNSCTSAQLVRSRYI